LSRIFLVIPNSRKDSRQAGMTLKTNIQFLTPCGLCRRVLHEMIPVVLAVVLCQYGYDVLAAKEANMFGKSDEEQLDFAVSNRSGHFLQEFV